MPYMSIGLRIKQARLARKPKVTQQQLADEVGVSRPAVTQWETGETKTLEGENLVRVARALGVSADWLLYGVGLGPGVPQPVKSVKAVVDHQQVIELTQEVATLAQRIYALPAQDRAVLLAMVDSLTNTKKDCGDAAGCFCPCDPVDVAGDDSDARGSGRWGS